MEKVIKAVELEPGSAYLAENGDFKTHAIVSIAVSLKRIADALTYQPGPDNLYDHLKRLSSATEELVSRG
jgi:hypothetical protein